jgi:endonuclease/exonuclease/phosphatase family metal-dependent hydrolase
MKRYEFSTLLWNVCTGDNAEVRKETSWHTRGPRVRKFLQNNTADIMCLVELSRSGRKNIRVSETQESETKQIAHSMNIYKLAAPFPGHHLVFRSYGGFSLGALVNTKKFVVGDVRVCDIAPDVMDAYNIIMFVDLIHKRSDTPFTLAVTHLPAKHEHRQYALERFAECVNALPDDRRLLICGDFNIDGTENYDRIESSLMDVEIRTREIVAKHDNPEDSNGPHSVASEILRGTYLGFRDIGRSWRELDTAGGFDIIMTRGIDAQVPETPDFMGYEFGDTCETYTYPSDHLAIHCRMFLDT